MLVLLAGTAGSLVLSQVDPALGTALAFTVGHFFFFCNIIRMARQLELAWAALFVLCASGTLLARIPTWPQTFGLCLACTATLTVIQLRRPSYHGVFWQRLNPGLPQWWTHHGEGVR